MNFLKNIWKACTLNPTKFVDHNYRTYKLVSIYNLYSYISRLNIVLMTILYQLIYRIYAIAIKMSANIFIY